MTDDSKQFKDYLTKSAGTCKDELPVENCEEVTDQDGGLNRRDYLRLGTATAVAVTGSAAVQSVAAASGRHGISFDRVVDAVDDLGLDPTGSEPIDGVLESALANGALVEFPAGDYRVTREISVGTTSGILGLGDDRSGVRFVPDRGLSSIWLRFSKPDAFLVENVTLDRRDDYDTSIGMMGNVRSNLQIHEVEYTGWTPSGPQMLVCNVLDPDGELVADGFYRLGPTRFEKYPGSSLDIYIGTASEATHTLRNLEIHNGSESAIYAGKAPGPVHVEDSYFKNCVHTAVRVAGKDSWVKRTTVIMDTNDWDPRNEVVESTYDGNVRIQLNRGIWTQTYKHEKAGPLVEDCDVIVKNAPGAISGIHNVGDSGGIRIRNTRVQCDEDDAKPIYIAEEWNHDVMNPPYYAQIENVSVTGTCSDNPAILVENRDGTTIKNCCIDLPNSRGIVFNGTQDGLVEDSNISTGGEATVFNDARVEIVNVGEASSCPLPATGSQPSEDSGSTGTAEPTTETSTPTATETGTGSSTEQKLEVLSVDSGPLFAYEFTVEGEVERIQDGSDTKAESSDAVVDNGDGTHTVTGKCGNGYGDAFELEDPTFTSFQADASPDDYYLRLDGQEVVVDDLLSGDGSTGDIGDKSNGDNYLFTNRTELQAVADKANSGTEPWASAWAKVQASADNALGVSLQSVTDDDGSNYFGLDDNDRHDYREAISTGDRVRNLALAHFVTGDDTYAEKAIDQIHHWFLDSDTYQYPTGSGDYGVEQYITIPKFLMGAAILRGHSYWDTKSAGTPWNGGSAVSPEDALAEWAVTWANNLTEPNYNNIWIWLAVAEASAGVYARDDALFQSAVDRYKSDPAWNDYNDDGSFQAALNRSNGFRYQLFRMKAHLMFCEIGRNRGIDLYSHNDLKKSFDWMASYVQNPNEWQWGASSLDFDLNHEAPGVYELAHSIWQEPAHLDVVQQAGRPVDDGRLLQWVTFSHGNLFDLDSDSGGDSTSLPNTIYVDGTGSTSSYRFEVSEEARKVDADSTDTVSGVTIKGSVTDEQDVYEFAGDVTTMEVDGFVNISFDSSST